MGSHSVTCHPAKLTFPSLPQPKLVLYLATPEGCKAELTCTPQVQELYPLYPLRQKCGLCQNFKQTTLTARLYKVRTNLYPHLRKRSDSPAGCPEFISFVRGTPTIIQQFLVQVIVFKYFSLVTSTNCSCNFAKIAASLVQMSQRFCH